MNHEDELQNLSNFLGKQMKKLQDLITDNMYAYSSFYKANMNHVFRPDDLIAINDNGEIDLEVDTATHKILSIYSTINCDVCDLVLLDVITNEPLIFKLK